MPIDNLVGILDPEPSDGRACAQCGRVIVKWMFPVLHMVGTWRRVARVCVDCADMLEAGNVASGKATK